VTTASGISASLDWRRLQPIRVPPDDPAVLPTCGVVPVVWRSRKREAQFALANFLQRHFPLASEWHLGQGDSGPWALIVPNSSGHGQRPQFAGGVVA
jgi:hypothetical protein